MTVGGATVATAGRASTVLLPWKLNVVTLPIMTKVCVDGDVTVMQTERLQKFMKIPRVIYLGSL